MSTGVIWPKTYRLTRKECAARRAYEQADSYYWIGFRPDGQEEWRHVPGFEGLYRVSSEGRVFKTWKHGGGIMKTRRKPSGYCAVSLTNRGKSVIRYVHQLVAAAFLPNPDKRPHVNHKNFNPSDNRVENLEWVYPCENIQYSRRAGRYPAFTVSLPGESNPRAILTVAKVKEIRGLISDGVCDSAIGRTYGVTTAAINRIRNGKNWSSVR